jgi:hypothetical protein
VIGAYFVPFGALMESLWLASGLRVFKAASGVVFIFKRLVRVVDKMESARAPQPQYRLFAKPSIYHRQTLKCGHIDDFFKSDQIQSLVFQLSIQLSYENKGC